MGHHERRQRQTTVETKESPVKPGTYLTTDGEVKPIFFKTPYNHDRDAESNASALTCNDKSLTQQQFKEETDINFILERYRASQQIPPMALPEHYFDLSERPSYHEIQTALADANAKFYLLDPKIRAEHLNSPARWADQVIAATETGNLAELRKLGLDAPDPAPEPPTPTGGTPAPVLAEGAPSAPPKAPSGAKD